MSPRQATSVQVWVPWRDHPSRRAGLEFCTRYWTHRLGLEPRLLDVDTDPFNLAAIRNEAVRQSTADVVVLADADTVPEPGPFLQAVKLAADGAGTVLPYTQYRALTTDGTKSATRGAPLVVCAHRVVPRACSGVYVTTPRGWWAHGGQDEAFAGWGCEDAAWHIAHTTLLGAPRRVKGRVFALAHPAQDKTGEPTRRNFQRIVAYQQAAGHPEAIRELIGGTQ